MEATSYGAQQSRKIFTARKDKQKDGKPVLKLWMPELPPVEDRKNRVFETHQSQSGERHYEIFASLSGIVSDIYQSEKNIAGEDCAFLCLTMQSGGEEITYEVSRIDHRFAMNLMARFLNAHFNFAEKVTLSPYDITKEGKNYIGVSVQQGADKIDNPGRELNAPQPRTWEGRGGKIEYDFIPVAKWLLAQCQEKIKSFAAAPTQTSVKPSPAANMLDSSNVKAMLDAFETKGLQEPAADDDLPF